MISTKQFKELNYDNILDKISEYDIFKYYVSNFRKLGVPFCSDIRKDRNPDVYITKHKGSFFYKDFSHPEHTFNALGYVMYKYGITYREALEVINVDFGLKLGFRLSKRDKRAIVHNPKDYESEKSDATIRIVSKKMSSRDFAYFIKYHIKRGTLEFYNVKSIVGYYLNRAFYRIKKHDIAFAYCFGNYKYKLLQPYGTIKWISNTDISILQGYDQLPRKGNICFITSSLKDVMVLYELGYPAVAPISESARIPERYIKELKERFDHVILFYDNDDAGLEYANIRSKEYDIPYIYIPIEFSDKYTGEPLKDPSDFCRQEGLVDTRVLIDSLL